MAVSKESVKKVRDESGKPVPSEDSSSRKVRVEILSEVLWTLSNLVSEDNHLDERLQWVFGIRGILQDHLLENFTEEAYQTKP